MPVTLGSVTDITRLLLTWGCREVQDENVLGVSLTTVARGKERRGFFSLVLQCQGGKRETLSTSGRSVSLVCSSRVNHGEHSFYRVRRNKNELILMEILPLDTAQGYRILAANRAKPLVGHSSVCLLSFRFDFFFFFGGARGFVKLFPDFKIST